MPPADKHGTPIASAADGSDRELYLQGSCHVLAAALHRRYGMSILVVCDPDSPYWSDPADADNFIPSVLHCYAVDADGTAWDVLGGRPVEAVARELLDRHPDVERTDTELLHAEDDLALFVDGMTSDGIDRPLHAYTETDVAEADACALRALGHMLPPPRPAP